MILALAGQFKQLSHEPEKFHRTACNISFICEFLLSYIVFIGKKRYMREISPTFADVACNYKM